VNGNGANGKNDGVSGGHRHTLEESDRVKKNSVQRYLLKDKGKKKGSVRLSFSSEYAAFDNKLGAWHPANWLRHSGRPLLSHAFFSPCNTTSSKSKFCLILDQV
jgi:hypothetical protein